MSEEVVSAPVLKNIKTRHATNGTTILLELTDTTDATYRAHVSWLALDTLINSLLNSAAQGPRRLLKPGEELNAEALLYAPHAASVAFAPDGKSRALAFVVGSCTLAFQLPPEVAQEVARLLEEPEQQTTEMKQQ